MQSYLGRIERCLELSWKQREDLTMACVYSRVSSGTISKAAAEKQILWGQLAPKLLTHIHKHLLASC